MKTVRWFSTVPGIVALLAAWMSLGAQREAEHAGQYAQADIQYGSTIYSGQCIQCHGPTGDQIGGVNLKSGRFRNASTDDDLRRIVTQGIPGTSMPGRQFDPPQITAIVAFLRNMRDFDTAAVKLGDAGKGRAVFAKAQCGSCHQVNGQGSHVGPDLSDIGRVRAAGSLQQSLVDPSSRMMPINRPVRIVLEDGTIITGRRLNEDTFMVQLIDSRERLLSLDKSDLREFTILQTSSMPSFKDKLDDQEMADIVAYLVSLKEQ